MPLTLYVDGPRWRGHQARLRERHPAVVPVIKGNGYGFGLERLAARAAALGVDTVAVGTYQEVVPVAREFPGSVLVMGPWRPFETRAVLERHVVHTVSRLEDLRALTALGDQAGARPRVVLERLTSMRRHGMSARDLREAAELLDGVAVEGVALHLPLPLRQGSASPASHLTEVDRLLTDVVAAGLPTTRVFVSHLAEEELAALRQSYPDHELRPRIGTELWLGDRDALSVRAAVTDGPTGERGDVYGYRSRTAPAAGTILVVSGGTAHGIGLESPTGGATLKDRAARIAKGGLDAAGFVRSPYTVDGKLRLFAEPPHMQVSMLFLSSGARVPEIGEEVAVRVRFTATSFEETVVNE